MHAFFLFFLALLPTQAFAGIRVVATVSDLGAIAREVGGSGVTVTTLALPSQDPHFVDARPNLALELSKADLLLLVGLDLEVGWLPTLVTGARNPKVQVGATGYLDCSQFVSVLDAPTQKVDRAMGDVHPGGNPHYLYDPRVAAKVAAGIAGRMGAIDPANVAVYANNAAAFVQKLNAARSRWESTLAPLKGREVVTYHKSMAYLANWLGFTVAQTVEPKPGIPPSPQQVATVIGTVTSRKITMILAEEYYPATTAQLVADKTGAHFVALAGGTGTNETYISRFDALTAKLAGAL